MTQPFEPSVGNESNWVRSLYVYAVCLISMVVVLIGAALTVSSAVTIISPSTGLTSGWERVLVGGTTVVEEGVKIAEDYMDSQRNEMPDFCVGTVSESDVEYCDSIAEDMAEMADEPIIPAEVDDAISLVRDEVLRQVRMAAIGRFVIGLVVVAFGAFVFLRHKGLTALYQSGPDAAPTPASPVVVQPAPPTQPVVAPSSPVPPAPPAPPISDWSSSQ